MTTGPVLVKVPPENICTLVGNRRNLRDDLQHWLDHECTGGFEAPIDINGVIYFWFKSENDAMVFKLTWGGQ